MTRCIWAATFVTASFLAGWFSATVIGAPPPDVFTLATEFATRNIAVATAIPLMLCAIVVYRRSRPGL